MDSPGKTKKPLVAPRPPKLTPGPLNLLQVGQLTPPLLSPGPVSPRTPTSASPPVSRLRQRFGRIFGGGGGSASQPPSPTTPERTSSPAVSHSFEELTSGQQGKKNFGSVSSEPEKKSSSPQSPSRRANWRSKSDSAKVLKSMRQ